ncbi:MAG: formate dehydrogenase family accessory protein FdhD [Euryarchaeota archaeon]|jgi:FdhD protein|nr:formate dehydrogenase family accessory protein FdhD [Euryarchaeota archaeon]|tara:strand:+ start:3279 stop:4082 length:804 start_codon:yes stop_codon:yes gene_type:complete
MSGFETREIAKLTEDGIIRSIDYVASESPLSLVVESNEHGRHDLGITMRTTGHDRLLSLGFIYSEGIITSAEDIEDIVVGDGVVDIILNDGAAFDPSEHCRTSTVTSSCGICGRLEISNILTGFNEVLDEGLHISMGAITKCLNSVIERQEVFSKTGGSHACASFTNDGTVDRVYEDVGRHNAFDKLVGSYLQDGSMPNSGLAAFVSGRASFELVQKCIRAGFPIMIAVGAPSSLAVDLAREYGLTLGCFAKNKSITLFSGVRRVLE